MQKLSEELEKTVVDAEKKLNSVKDWDYRTAPGKWSKKQILGHLIDSAANNHQRFVRIQYEDTPLITYDQNQWAALQKCDDVPVDVLINLWSNYNQLLSHVISIIHADALNKKCNIGKEEHVTLDFIITDYLKHLNHHLGQIIL